jgi:hypothetical protein
MQNLPALKFLDRSLDNYETFFKEWVWPTLNPGVELSYSQSTQFMLELAQAFYAGKYRLCTLAIPPRNAKTTIFTIGLPVWAWLRNPRLDILTASASDDVIKDFHSDRSILLNSEDFKTFWKLLYAKELKNKDPSIWPTDSIKVVENPLGGKHYQWTNKSRTGIGFDLGILDDPIANSDADRNSVCTATYKETIRGHMARRHNKKLGSESPFIVVQQRLSSGDLIGRLQDKEGWEHFALPAIATEETRICMPLSGNYWDRKPGDVLNPGREDLETLIKIQNNDLRIFQAQYQQDPDKDVSNAVVVESDIQYYTEKQSEYEKVLMTVDTASKTAVGSSNWGIIVLGKWAKGYDVLYGHAKQYNYPDGKRQVLSIADQFEIDEAYIEDKSTGLALIPELVEAHRKGEVSFKTFAVQPGKVSKEARFIAGVPYVKSMCRFPKLTHLPAEVWVMLVLRELLGFPNCSTRDLADAISQYFYKTYATKKRRSNLDYFYGLKGVDSILGQGANVDPVEDPYY